MSRIYGDVRELMTEAARDLWEMGIEVRPKSYQNKVIEGQDEFITKEIQNYMYALVAMPDPENLFLFEDTWDWAKEEFFERCNNVCDT